MDYAYIHKTVEQSTPEPLLPPSSFFGPGLLLISRDGEDDIHSIRVKTTSTNSIEADCNNLQSSRSIHSSSSIPTDFNNQDNKPKVCDFCLLLKSCWSWFCGLDDNTVIDDKDDTSVGNGYYCGIQRKKGNDSINTRNESLPEDVKEKPIIKWILNGNLLILIFKTK